MSQVSTNGAGAVTYSAQAYQDSFDTSPQSLTAYTKNTDGTYDANTVLDDKLVTFEATPSATELFRLTELKAIDGVAVDNALVDAAIVGSDINAHDLLLARGAVGQIVTFANPNDTDGIHDATTTPATPWTIPSEVQRLGASLTSIQGLIAAIKSGNGLGLATSSFNTLEALDGPFDGTLADLGAGLNGATAILGLKGALERGDMLSAISSGLTISKMALTAYQGALSSQVAGMATNVAFIFEHVPVAERTAAQLEAIAEHAALNTELAVVGDVLKGIGKALPFLSVLISLKNGDYEGAIVALVALKFPVVGWIYAGIKLIQGLLQNDDPQGEARLMAGGADGTDVWVWANGELGGEKATKDMMQAVLLKPLGDSFAGVIAPKWEVATAFQQHQLDLPQAGRSTLEWAKLDGTLLAANTGTTQAVRSIVLDLGADGVRTGVDPVFSPLQVWQDITMDGVAAAQTPRRERCHDRQHRRAAVPERCPHQSTVVAPGRQRPGGEHHW